MKNLRVVALLYVFLGVLSACGSGHNRGTDTGGGGTVGDIQKAIVDSKKEHLVSELVRITQDRQSSVGTIRSAVLSFSTSYLNYSQLSVKTVQMVEDMNARGLKDDIHNTEIKIGKCRDKDGIKRSATAPMNEIGGAICLDPEEVVDSLGAYISDAALIALFMHEYSHHYGYEDKDYSFAVDIARAVEAESDQSVRNGESGNYLIRP